MKKENVTLKNVLLLIALVAIIILIFKSVFNTGGNEKKVTDFPTMNEVEELKELKTKTGMSVFEMQHLPTKTIVNSGIPREKYESILRELQIKENQVRALTLVSGTIKDSLKLTKLELDEAKNKVWKWEKTLPSGTKIVREMSEKDSVLKENSDIAVAVIDKTEGRGKNVKFYTDFYSLDNNIKFNGASVFRKENAEIRDIIQVDAGIEFQKSFLSPNARILSDVQLSFFPDGQFIPSVKVGGLYDVENGLDWFWGVRAKYNLFKIKNNK